MRRIVFALASVAGLAGAAAYMAPASGRADGEAAPIYGVQIPPGYRDWRLISVGRLAGGKLKQLRAQLGNDIAIDAFRAGKLPFPDGTIIAALHWKAIFNAREVLFGDFHPENILLPCCFINSGLAGHLTILILLYNT